MRGYICDRCGAVDPGRSDQRDGSQPPAGWESVGFQNRHLCAQCVETTFARSASADDAIQGEGALVTLFKRGGKYYTEERWAIPGGALGPFDMDESPNFRRIDGGAVLVESQEPWGFPHLFPAEGSE